MLVPTRAPPGHEDTTMSADRDAGKGKEQNTMDDLVNHLAALEPKETL